MPGRTDNDVKNYWNTKLKKKLKAVVDCNPSNRSDLEPAIAASNTAAATAAAAGAATTYKIVDKNTIFQAPTNLLGLQDYCFPVPFLPENATGLVNANAQSVSYEPINFSFPRFIVEGSSDCSSANNSFPFSPSQQDSSPFRPFSLGMDENYGVKMDEYSYEVVSGIWSQEEAIGADSNADLFSIFHVDSKSQGVSQSH